MLKIASIALLGVFAFALITPVAFARDLDYIYTESSDDISWGIHPWDVQPRRYYVTSRVDPYRYGKDYYYLHPDRSQTHALHPYHRENYYAQPVDPDYVRYSRLRLSDVRYSVERAYVPSRSSQGTCMNLSYSRPNYRVPPYGYFCN